ncbi:MAG TPA: helix-turn-helix domain-containing protein [Candidatus Dormibacteraeota bacterium]|nr:helix-turn-helix domain-containing protein [Candidatus Dormibacteraeota bacterium]
MMHENLGMRERILAATIAILRSEGLSGATTRAIAQRAGVAEGSIYRHFEDKTDLVQTAVREHALPAVLEAAQSLLAKAGSGRVRDHVRALLETLYAFYRDVVPLMAAVAAEQETLESFRRGFERRAGGPQRASEPIAAYLRTEQGLGRVAPEIDPDATAVMLLGACFYQAFMERLLGTERVAVQTHRLLGELAKMVER